MKITLLSRVCAGLTALVLLGANAGCTTGGSTPRAVLFNPNNLPTYALAVAVRGGVAPTPAQWNAMYQKFSRSLAARGFLLIIDHAKADHIIYVEFLPDPINPEIGTALVSSISPNTGVYGRTATVSQASYANSYSSSTAYANNSWARTNNYHDNYGNYNRDESSGSSYAPPPSASFEGKLPVPPVVTRPPHRSTNPEACPPGTSPYLPPPSYVSNHRHNQGPREGGHTPPAYSSSRPVPSYDGALTYSASSSGRSSSGSSSDHSSSYSSSSYHSPAPSPAYSAPSYSAPVSSSLSYSPQGDSSSSSASSSSSSSSGSGSSSSSNHQPN